MVTQKFPCDIDAGADHIIVMTGAPFDLGPLQSLIDQRNKRE